MCLICDRIEMIKNGSNPYFVRELETGYVVIGDHQYFKGYTLFLCKIHETELFYLPEDFRKKFLWEMSLVAEAAAKAFRCDKMNYELLGNGDTHVHWHLFPRRQNDLGTYGDKGPVWWVPLSVWQTDATRPTPEELEALKARLGAELDKLL